MNSQAHTLAKVVVVPVDLTFEDTPSWQTNQRKSYKARYKKIVQLYNMEMRKLRGDYYRSW